jgi:hypothetical protein
MLMFLWSCRVLNRGSQTWGRAPGAVKLLAPARVLRIAWQQGVSSKGGFRVRGRTHVFEWNHLHTAGRELLFSAVAQSPA